MRIIAGEFRGRSIIPPDSDTTRPITDRAKQSIFDVLSPLIPDAIIYDCFSGTGSMGLECLSRGAAHATFFDADRSALANLKKNIAALKVEARSRIVPGDLFKFLSNTTPPLKAQLIFLDPPYRYLVERPEPLQKLARDVVEKHLAPDGIVIFRHDTKDALPLQPLVQRDLRQYGSMTIELLGRPSGSEG